VIGLLAYGQTRDRFWLCDETAKPFYPFKGKSLPDKYGGRRSSGRMGPHLDGTIRFRESPPRSLLAFFRISGTAVCLTAAIVQCLAHRQSNDHLGHMAPLLFFAFDLGSAGLN